MIIPQKHSVAFKQIVWLYHANVTYEIVDCRLKHDKANFDSFALSSMFLVWLDAMLEPKITCLKERPKENGDGIGGFVVFNISWDIRVYMKLWYQF